MDAKPSLRSWCSDQTNQFAALNAMVRMYDETSLRSHSRARASSSRRAAVPARVAARVQAGALDAATSALFKLQSWVIGLPPWAKGASMQDHAHRFGNCQGH